MQEEHMESQLITLDSKTLAEIIRDLIPWGGGEPLDESDAEEIVKEIVERAITESQKSQN